MLPHSNSVPPASRYETYQYCNLTLSGMPTNCGSTVDDDDEWTMEETVTTATLTMPWALAWRSGERVEDYNNHSTGLYNRYVEYVMV